jgi:hypothetical protein
MPPDPAKELPGILSGLKEGLTIVKSLPRIASTKLSDANSDYKEIDSVIRGIRIGRKAPKKK